MRHRLDNYLFYQEPGITLYCGDCREVLPRLESVTAMVTDPPYGVDFSYDVHNDDPSQYHEVLARLQMAEGLVVDGWCVVFQSATSWREWATRFPQSFVQMGNTCPVYATDYALAWKIGTKQRRETWHPQGFRDWFRCAPADMRHPARHPCPRPLDGMRYLISGFCPPGGTVLDPFAGSGTTLRAAKDTGRHAIGIEISPRYCEAAVELMRQEVLSGV